MLEDGRPVGFFLLDATAFVAARFPCATSVVLTVNARNPAARSVYLSGGFVDSGELYLGGSAGPQQVLRLELSGSGTIDG